MYDLLNSLLWYLSASVAVKTACDIKGAIAGVRVSRPMGVNTICTFTI